MWDGYDTRIEICAITVDGEPANEAMKIYMKA